jgi:hypothetical protein
VLTNWHQKLLAQGYGLDAREVVRDATLVARWHGPADDLLAILRERHAWGAAAAYRYLRTLRRALIGQLPG